MPWYTFVARSLAVVAVVLLVVVPPAFANRVNCRDVTAALAEGRNAEEARQYLGTTATRVEACQRIALDRIRHEDRRAAQHLRHAQRELIRAKD
jgi:hypothetical protein